VARRENFNPTPIVITIALNLAISFSFPSEIDWRGHVGGLIVGAAVMALLAYAPRNPRRTQLQIAGMAVVAVVLVGLSVVGIQHVKNECRRDVAAGGLSANVAFCQVYDPGQ
jgi:hypothetical protein